MALAAATAFEVRRLGRAAGLVSIDHSLQDGSAAQAAAVAALGYELGLDPVVTLPVEVGSAGGQENAARVARYLAFDAVRGIFGSAVGDAFVLLGHTADDQAESVLLGLGRGSGPRSIAGMRPQRDGYLRPFLGLRRAETRAACVALGLPIWDDPHNLDSRFARVRVRTEVLPLLEQILRGGVVEALTRTARLLQEDLEALDEWAAEVYSLAVLPDGGLEVAAIRSRPVAVQARVLKHWAESGGADPLTSTHLRLLVGLISDWHGQGPLHLPGGYSATRSSGTLTLSPPSRDQVH